MRSGAVFCCYLLVSSLLIASELKWVTIRLSRIQAHLRAAAFITLLLLLPGVFAWELASDALRRTWKRVRQ